MISTDRVERCIMKGKGSKLGQICLLGGQNGEPVLMALVSWTTDYATALTKQLQCDWGSPVSLQVPVIHAVMLASLP